MKFRVVLGGVLLSVLLGGCIKSLIPDQNVKDLYGFNNFKVDLTLSPSSSASARLVDQASAIVAAGSVSRQVDSSESLGKLPFNPTTLSESVKAKTIRLFAPQAPLLTTQAITDDLPLAINLTSASFDINFTDGTSTVNKTFDATFSPNAIFQRDDASCSATFCDYLPVGSAVASLAITIAAQEAKTTLEILASNQNPKTARGDSLIGFAADPKLANVQQAQMTIETFGGVISFK